MILFTHIPPSDSDKEPIEVHLDPDWFLNTVPAFVDIEKYIPEWEEPGNEVIAFAYFLSWHFGKREIEINSHILCYDAMMAIHEATAHAKKIKDAMRPDLAEHITDEFFDIGFWMDRIAPTAWFTSERELVGFVFLVMYKHVNKVNDMKTEKVAELPDDLNPKFIFCNTATELLLQIATGKIDAVDYARKELAARGTGKNGEWVGFKEAERQWEVKK